MIMAKFKLGHDSDTMLDKHDSTQWYDFVRHLRILLAWLSLGHGSDTMLD